MTSTAAAQEALFLVYARYYRWPGDPKRRIYETLTTAEVGGLSASQLREAIDNSAAVLRDIDTGELVVFDALAMEALPAGSVDTARHLRQQDELDDKDEDG
jgi:hypothetical protein